MRNSQNHGKILACHINTTRKKINLDDLQSPITIEEEHIKEKLVMPVEQPNINMIDINPILKLSGKGVNSNLKLRSRKREMQNRVENVDRQATGSKSIQSADLKGS